MPGRNIRMGFFINIPLCSRKHAITVAIQKNKIALRFMMHSLLSLFIFQKIRLVKYRYVEKVLFNINVLFDKRCIAIYYANKCITRDFHFLNETNSFAERREKTLHISKEEYNKTIRLLLLSLIPLIICNDECCELYKTRKWFFDVGNFRVYTML